MSDTLQKFMFDNSLVRGELVEISDAWQEIQSRRHYPSMVSKVLGEMMAAAALLSANLKFDGTIIMQIHGDGPVPLLVVELDPDRIAEVTDAWTYSRNTRSSDPNWVLVATDASH